MVDYTIAAIPTLYNGIQYRSRLEARWAAFFDAMNWHPKYEPFDLGKWSPDFMINITSGDYLVEVKPITEFDQPVADKITRAIGSKAPQSKKFGGVILVGISPQIDPPLTAVALGWVNPYQRGELLGWRKTFIVWGRDAQVPLLHSDICREEFLSHPDIHPYAEGVRLLWADASNIVQWQARA